MSVTVRRNAGLQGRRPETLEIAGRRYTLVDALAQGPRADLSIAVAEDASSLEELVVIERFHPEAAVMSWASLVAELKLASRLEHAHVVQSWGVELEPDRCLLAREYLEGATLRACLDWAAATQLQWSSAVVVRILLAILEAVRYAAARTDSTPMRALVWGPLAAEDVFLTHDGQVKLLGFKSAQRQRRANESAVPAIDALLEQQLTVGLRALLSSLPPAYAAGTHAWSDELIDTLQRSGSKAASSDGRAELVRLVINVERPARAQRALSLVAAFSQLRGPTLRFRKLADPEDAPAQSGYRRIDAVAIESSEPPASRDTLESTSRVRPMATRRRALS